MNSELTVKEWWYYLAYFCIGNTVGDLIVWFLKHYV